VLPGQIAGPGATAAAQARKVRAVCGESRAGTPGTQHRVGTVALATRQRSSIVLLGRPNPRSSLPAVCWGARKASRTETWPPRGEETGQLISRRNGGSLDKATVTLMDSLKYCWAGTSFAGWESPVPSQAVSHTAAKAGQGQAGMDPAPHGARPASGEVGFRGCQTAHPHPRRQ